MSATPETRRAVDRRGELLGSGLSVLMAVLFAFIVIMGKDVLSGDLPFIVLTIRFAGQTVILLLVLLILRRPLVAERGERLPLVLAATLGYGTESAAFFAGVSYGSAAAITLLFYIYPVLVMVATIGLDRRRPAAGLFVALGLAFSGSLVVVLGSGELELQTLGIVLALGTAFAYTGYVMTADRFVKRTDPLTAAMWLGGGAAVANLVYAVAFDVVELPPSSAWPTLGLMAVFSAGAFVAMVGGLQLVGAVRNSIIGILEALTVALLAVVFLHEPITLATATGGLLILVGAVIATTVRTTRTAEPNV